ncbi:MAG TPA: hypothetical protein ENF57_01420 [Candidatus Korarchaeota archaeon]|nr:hypothetical protein [Candidatus Korarchaeota archaeon]
MVAIGPAPRDILKRYLVERSGILGVAGCTLTLSSFHSLTFTSTIVVSLSNPMIATATVFKRSSWLPLHFYGEGVVLEGPDFPDNLLYDAYLDLP